MEVDETVLLLLRNAKNASIEGQGEARLTIQDDDLDLPFVFFVDEKSQESENEANERKIKIQLSKRTARTVTGTYSIEGTAEEG